jgi:hypothetical protein
MKTRGMINVTLRTGHNSRNLIWKKKKKKKKKILHCKDQYYLAVYENNACLYHN